jgi:hypothetical protein
MKQYLLCLIPVLVFNIKLSAQTENKNSGKPYKEPVAFDSCKFGSSGISTYFILEPGYQLILKGADGNDTSQLIITVLKDTKMIGKTETRVVEEKESVNGKLTEISRNFYAICKQTRTIYYFGEEVDVYKNDEIIGHEGSWKAEGTIKAGIVMPGKIVEGAKYNQEMAPGVAMDMVEIISTNETMTAPAGIFNNCLKTLETSLIEPNEKENKFYAPGIGLIYDDGMWLTKYGFVK